MHRVRYAAALATVTACRRVRGVAAPTTLVAVTGRVHAIRVGPRGVRAVEEREASGFAVGQITPRTPVRAIARCATTVTSATVTAGRMAGLPSTTARQVAVVRAATTVAAAAGAAAAVTAGRMAALPSTTAWLHNARQRWPLENAMRTIVSVSVAHSIPARLWIDLLVGKVRSAPEPVGVHIIVVACLPFAILHLAIRPEEDAVRLDKAYACIYARTGMRGSVRRALEIDTLDGIKQVRIATVIHDVLAVDAFAMRYRLCQSQKLVIITEPRCGRAKSPQVVCRGVVRVACLEQGDVVVRLI